MGPAGRVTWAWGPQASRSRHHARLGPPPAGAARRAHATSSGRNPIPVNFEEPVYFAVDFDIADYAPGSASPKAKLGPAADCFAAINALTPRYTVGVYGGYYAVPRVLSAGLAARPWQTIAWSGGQWDDRAVLRQLGSEVWGSNADVDLLAASAADSGQWPRPTAPEQFRASGTTSLREAAHRHGMTVSEPLWLTAQHKQGGYGPLEVSYIDDGNWDTDMPAGMIFWA